MTKKGRKPVAMLLAMAMVITFMPLTSQAAYAEETDKTTAPAYIDASSLGEDTAYGLYRDGTTQATAQAVYFGKNGDTAQKWWIAGNDGKGLVLMCDPDQPFTTNAAFEDNKNDEKPYSADWNCIYSGNDPYKVNPNHYGASDIRQMLLDELGEDSSRFTTTEKELMKAVPIHTYDFKNKMSYYTTDKLYLAACCDGIINTPVTQYVTVGSYDTDSNTSENMMVNNGLRIGLVSDNAPSGSPFTIHDSSQNNFFWTRTPSDWSAGVGMEAIPGLAVQSLKVSDIYTSVTPAFDLDMGSVLFASAAEGGKSSASLDPDNVMTLRCDGADRISSTATRYSNAVTVSKADDSSDVYLYVQGNDGTDDWVWSGKIGAGNDIVTIDGHPDLTGCEVWLETCEDGVVYAKKADISNAAAITLVDIGNVRRDRLNAAEPLAFTGEINPNEPGLTDQIELADEIWKSTDGTETFRSSEMTDTKDVYLTIGKTYSYTAIVKTKGNYIFGDCFRFVYGGTEIPYGKLNVSYSSDGTTATIKGFIADVTIAKLSNAITMSTVAKTVTGKVGSATAFTRTAKATSGKVNYSDSSKYASVDSTGKVTINKNFTGTFKVTVTSPETAKYKAATKKSYTVKVKPGKMVMKKPVNVKTRKIKATWAKMNGADKYQIRVAYNSKMTKGKKTYTVKGSAKSKTTGKLKKGKIYYVQIRAYDTQTKSWSTWSAKKKCKIKK